MDATRERERRREAKRTILKLARYEGLKEIKYPLRIYINIDSPR